MDVRTLQPAELDAMREIANIGAGHAATALSQMTGRSIMIDVPQLHVLRVEQVDRMLGEPDEVVAAVLMKVLGDVTGRTVQVFPAASAVKLTNLMLPGPAPSFPDGFDAMHQSALKEIGNTIVGAYLSALSEFMGLVLIMSVPSLAIDMAGAILTTSYINFGDARDHVFCVNTTMRIEGDEISGSFLLIPDSASLQVMLRQLDLAG
jgi:chemotaxis protein CheC